MTWFDEDAIDGLDEASKQCTPAYFIFKDCFREKDCRCKDQVKLNPPFNCIPHRYLNQNPYFLQIDQFSVEGSEPFPLFSFNP